MIYFLSDAHLGSLAIEDSKAHQQKFIALLEQMSQDASAIYMLGDIFDFWCEYWWRDRSKEQFAPVFECLQQLANKGIDLHFFIGNHDLWTFGELARRMKATVHFTPCTMEINGKKIFMAHGDALLPRNWENLYPKPIQRKIRNFIVLRRIFHNPFCQALFRCLPPSWGNRFGYNWAKNSRLKELAKPCPYKGEGKEELVLFAKDQEKQSLHRDFYIFGHRHIELDLQISRDSRVMILGDCFQQWTFAQLDDHGRLSLNNF